MAALAGEVAAAVTWDDGPFTLGGTTFLCLPDVHLGRRFLADVPLHRRGERERMLEDAFLSHMAEAQRVKPDCHVTMGDLFDRPFVSPATVLLAADAYRRAVEASPDTFFVVLAGNHDIPRDLDAVCSFDLFARLVEPYGVTVVRSEPALWHGRDGLTCAFLPWHPARSSAEMAAEIALPVDIAFGHWDVVNPGSDHNLVPPIKARLMVTGHDHRRRVERAPTGAPLFVTGCVMPLTHAEDPAGALYRTVTLPELEAMPEAERRSLCLRVVLQPGERLPEGIDALQVKPLRAGQETAALPEVGFDDALDMRALFDEVFERHAVPLALREELLERYRSQ
jgi:hypothetical protein